MLQQLAGGMLVSIEIFFVTLLFSLPLGLLICFGRMSKNKVIRAIVSAYISIMRGTPLMLQLMVVYFGPYFIFGIRISMGYSLIAVFIAFAINYAAYFAEIYRGGIESMPVGQYEAAKILVVRTGPGCCPDTGPPGRGYGTPGGSGSAAGTPAAGRCPGCGPRS